MRVLIMEIRPECHDYIIAFVVLALLSGMIDKVIDSLIDIVFWRKRIVDDDVVIAEYLEAEPGRVSITVIKGSSQDITRNT